MIDFVKSANSRKGIKASKPSAQIFDQKNIN